jgi:hypothetical protein
LNRPLVIGAGSLAAVVVVALAVNRVREGGPSPPPEPPSVAAPAQNTSAPPGASRQAEANAAPDQSSASQGQTPNAATALPSFDVVRVNPQGQTVIAGRAAPNSEVTVHDGDQVIGKATADPRGEFAIVPDKPLPPGNRSLSLSAKVPGKDGTLRSAGDVLVAVPEPKHDLAGKPSEGGDGALALLVPHGGEGAVRPLQVPGANPAGSAAQKPGLALDVIEYDEKGHVSLAGRADPGAGLNFYLSGKFVGHAEADRDGKWSVKPKDDVASGLYQLRIDQVRKDGKVVARLALPFLRAEPTELAQGQSFTVQPGNSLWRIARHSYGVGTRFAVIYAANRDQIADPDLIYAGQVFKLPVQN